MYRRDLLATHMVDLLTTINVDLWAIATRVLPYESADLAKGAVCIGVPPLSGLSVGFGSFFVRGPLLVCWRLGVVLMDGGAFGWLLSVVWGSLGRRLGFSGTTIRGAACTCGVVCRRLRGFGLGRR